MRVLILGATGTIGNALLKAAVVAGHDVYAHTRSESARNALLAEEATAVFVGDAAEVVLAHASAMDVVVDCTLPQATEVLDAVKTVSRARMAAFGGKGGKERFGLTFVLSSGTWVHGEIPAEKRKTGLFAYSDSVPLSLDADPIPLVKARAELEDEIFAAAADGVQPIVIRPGMVYGRAGSFLGPFLFEKAYEAAKTGKVLEYPSKKGVRVTTIHIDDVAALYLAVIEKRALFVGQAVDCVNVATESFDEIVASAAVAAGSTAGYRLVEPTEISFESAMGTDSRVRSTAGTVAGWVPRHQSLVDGMALYYQAWLAGKSK
ncbi:uncharacterized protein V1510DRAFT_401910 [Dipodascopsis tothii]|uniref:uncharacterized protein n=1 Tax=Dipodascopsis tothii TaxID=44089 RepID=UPI0034CFC529